MKTDFKEIHIGECIQKLVTERKIETDRIINFFKTKDEMNILEMYQEKNLSTDILLKWSKLLEYDFFRLYSQHLILYAPPTSSNSKQNTNILPQFRKNIYTKEIIEFLLHLYNSGEKTKQQIIDDYKIPKTTLYKWISKYNKQSDV